MRLTLNNIGGIKLPPGKADYLVFDGELPGFGIRLRAGSPATFVFQYRLPGKENRKQRRMSLGKATPSTLAGARENARKLYARVALGEDPAGDRIEAKAKEVLTFAAVADQFFEWQRTKPRKNGMIGIKPRSLVELERHVLVHARTLHKRDIREITRADIAALLGTITKGSGHVAANRTRATLASLFTWARTEGLVDGNPVVETRVHEEKSRDRVLDNEELRLIWNALADDQFGSICKLLMLTAQRRTEIGALRWSEIQDGAVIVFPVARTKNGRVHTLPLSATARAIIEAQPRRANPDGTLRDLIFGRGDSGYSGWAKAKAALDARIAEINGGEPIADWHLHDLRRTCSTRFGDLGIQPHVIECVLNHVTGFRRGVAEVYNKSPYMREMAAALDLWAAHLLAVVSGEEPNVIPLQRGA